MNPQKNIWNHLKTKLFKPASRSSIEELIFGAKNIFNELNSDINKIRSLAYARSSIV
jgi:hypothetical protein